MKETYTLEQVAKFTGFTDRTLRSFLQTGILQGDKVNGKWQFTEQQVGEFIGNPAVRPGVESKGKAIPLDFLAAPSHENGACLVLDVSGTTEEISKITDYFCDALNSKPDNGCRFHCFGEDGQGRIYLSGPASLVAELAAGYKEAFCKKA